MMYEVVLTVAGESGGHQSPSRHDERVVGVRRSTASCAVGRDAPGGLAEGDPRWGISKGLVSRRVPERAGGPCRWAGRRPGVSRGVRWRRGVSLNGRMHDRSTRPKSRNIPSPQFCDPNCFWRSAPQSDKCSRVEGVPHPRALKLQHHACR